MLEVDIKEGLVKDVESVLESESHLRESLGFLFQTMLPLDVPLSGIESVTQDDKGRVHVVIPHRRDIDLNLAEDEAAAFVPKIQELIGLEKERVLRDVKAGEEALKEKDERFREYAQTPREPPTGG